MNNKSQFWALKAYKKRRKYDAGFETTNGTGPAIVVGEERILPSREPLKANWFTANKITEIRQKLIVTGASNKKFSLNFGIENIFNKKYASPVVPEAINYPVSPTNPLLNPGRNFKIGFKANF